MITQSAACIVTPAEHRLCPGHVDVTASSGSLLRVDCTCECHERLRAAIRRLTRRGS